MFGLRSSTEFPLFRILASHIMQSDRFGIAEMAYV
jgi:hypothetical protein